MKRDIYFRQAKLMLQILPFVMVNFDCSENFLSIKKRIAVIVKL